MKKAVWKKVIFGAVMPLFMAVSQGQTVFAEALTEELMAELAEEPTADSPKEEAIPGIQDVLVENNMLSEEVEDITFDAMYERLESPDESYTELVEFSDEAAYAPPVDDPDGVMTRNVGCHDYDTRATVPNSYLYRNGSNLIRVEALSDSNLLVETFTADYKLTDRIKLPFELPIFGGFYRGSNALFVMYGQENNSESNEAEVLRIVKYDFSWNRLASVSYYGINTTLPFRAGSSSFAEYGNRLYVRTCHQMYTSAKDGLKHQANMTFVINSDTMAALNSYYIVANVSYSAGYVSHSFNQFIRVEGKRVLSVDHGDAYPRSVVMVDYGEAAGGDSLNPNTHRNLLSMPGSIGENYTGVSVGGFEASGSNTLTAVNRVAFDGNYKSNVVRNISLLASPVSGGNVSEIALTDAAEDGEVTYGTPYLIRLTDDLFAVLWDVRDKSNRYSAQGTNSFMAVVVDANGKPLGRTKTFAGYLSDCTPIFDGKKLVWYVTGDESYNGVTAPRFYELELNGSNNKYELTDRIESFVFRMYQVALGRNPEASGLDNWSNQLRSGTRTGADIATGFYLSPEMMNKNLSNEDYVELAYRGMMNRGSDAGGKADWVEALQSGVSYVAIIRGFVGSQEFHELCAEYGIQAGEVTATEPRDQNVGLTKFVARLYTEALGRAFDVDGLNDWTGRILENPSKENILHVSTHGFLHSQEFLNKELNDEQYVRVLYRTYLGRNAEDDGLNDWLNRLANGYSRDDVAAGFANSPEFAMIMANYGL